MTMAVYLVSTLGDVSGIHGTHELGHTQVGRTTTACFVSYTTFTP